MRPGNNLALALLRELLELPAAQRDAELARRCPDDAGLRAQVRALLAADAGSAPGLDAPVSIAAGFDDPPDPLSGSRLGPFQVHEQVGRGGMGTVYRASRSDGDFAQEAAIKVVRRGLDTDDILARFRRERRILASLSHVNLARLIDGGLCPDGRPWFAMEFIRGEAITAWCDRHRLDLHRRIALLLQACAAVQHAHERLVVHRDLKPANILVDQAGQVRLLDFGIARLLDSSDGDAGQRAQPTQAAAALLTPEYAAPEQLAGAPVGVAADVYALGVLLYELLTGTLPHRIDRRDLGRARAQVTGGVPTRLASAISADTDLAGTPAARLTARATSLAGYRRQVRGDLERIVSVALAPEPERRYPTVQALAADLHRFLRGEPVAVVDAGWRYRLGKFVARHRLPVALAGAATLAIAVGVSGMLWQAGRLAAEAHRTMAASARAEAVKQFLVEALTAANPFVNPGQTPTVRQLLDRAAHRIGSELADQPALAAELHGVIGSSYRGLGEMEQAHRHLAQAMGLLDANGVPAEVAAEIKAEYAHALIGASRIDETLALVEEALPGIENLPGVGGLRSRLLLARATALRLSGRPESALAAQQAAAASACGDRYPPDQACVGALIELKYFHEAMGEREEALASARRAWQAARALHGERPHPQQVMAGGALGDALAAAGRSSEAIPLLEATLEQALAIYGPENFRYARALDWLAQAHDDAGNARRAAELTEQAFLIGAAAVPRNPLTPFWLHRIVASWLALQRPDRARAAWDRHRGELPDALPATLSDALDLLELRLRMQEGPRAPGLPEQFEALFERLTSADSTRLDSARLLGAGLALDRGDPDRAASLIAAAATGIEADPLHPAHGELALLRARQQAATGQPGLALAGLDVAIARLQGREMTASPAMARLRAERGGLRCALGDPEAGREDLAAATMFWRELAESAQGIAETRAAAAGCR
ncbi:MAG: serine/threonine protein kinase [Xanthomonadales bacterium]|nr:serine/threonine protein kinase [Xanthomonadales bacterium]